MEDWRLTPARDLDHQFFRRWRSVQRETGFVESLVRFFWWGTVRALLRTVHRLEVTGWEHLPKAPPFVVAANHSSHLDALVLAATMPLRWRDCVFPLAAGDTFFEKSAVAAFAATCLNAIPVWRKQASSKGPIDLRKRLEEDQCIYIVFPEGTRSRDGAIGAFKAGVGMLTAGSPIPVVPCRLRGAFESFPPGRFMPRPRKVTLRIGPPLSFETDSNDAKGWRRIAAMLEASIRDL